MGAGNGSRPVADIRCHSCGKRVGRDEGNRVVVRMGREEIRIYQAAAIGITCPRCGKSQDMPAGLTKA